MATVKKTYEAWIETHGRMETRIVVVHATGEREAFHLARAICGVDEFVRGVIEA